MSNSIAKESGKRQTPVTRTRRYETLVYETESLYSFYFYVPWGEECLTLGRPRELSMGDFSGFSFEFDFPLLIGLCCPAILPFTRFSYYRQKPKWPREYALSNITFPIVGAPFIHIGISYFSKSSRG